MSHYVFLSCADEDRDTAADVSHALKQAGLECWMAPVDPHYRSEPDHSTIEGIAASGTVLLVFSRQTNHSPRVARELEQARSHGLPTFVLPLEDALPANPLRDLLADAHWFEMLKQPLGPGVAPLAAFIKESQRPAEARASTAGSPCLTFHHYAVMQRDDGQAWEIGRGAMGITYKAIDSRLRRSVALKIVSPERLTTESSRERFLLEAQAIASLNHPHIASIYYFGEQDGDCFYAMEYIDGPTLEQLVQEQGRLATDEALTIASQAAAALAAAHRAGMVHRDIKPGNIMVVRTPDGSPSARIIDFGLAAAAGGESRNFEGTPLYASPEQLEQTPLDARSDIYSLGATLYFCLAGHPPYQGTYAEIASRQVIAGFPAEPLAHLPPEVVALIARMLDTDPRKRPQDGGEAGAQIDETLRNVRLSTEQSAEDWMLARFGGVDRLGSMEGGFVYRTMTPDRSQEFAVLFFDKSAEGLAVVDRVRQSLPTIRSLESPAVRRVIEVAEVKDGFVLSTEWLAGTRLLSILRVRRVLSPVEAGYVLMPLAKALDEASSLGLPLPQLTLRDILLQPAEKPETRLDCWKDLRPVIDLLPVGEAAQSDVNTTITHSSALEQIVAYEASERKPAALIASLAYEILGGTTAPGLGPYVPLAELSKEANGILRDIFQNPHHNVTATDLVTEILPTTKPTTAPQAADPKPTPKFARKKLQRHRKPAAPAQPLNPTPTVGKTKKPRATPAVLGTAGAVLLILTGWYFFLRPPGDSTQRPPADTSIAQSTADSTAATDEANTAIEDKLKAAQELESQQDFAGALALYADLLQIQPRDKGIFIRIDNSVARIEEVSQSFAGHQDLRATLQKLADADHPRSAALLGEFLQQEDPARSFALYEKAAQLGDRHAMVLAGLMLASGQGTSRSEEKAAEWFRKSADLGYSFAMRCYAEVLLDGRGVPHNPSEAARLYSSAASLGDIPSKSRLADLWRRGIGVPAADHNEALRLFAEATDDGCLDAQANLGVMLMNGEGIAPDPAKAVELWQDGATRGDPQSMFLLAVSLLKGALGTPDPAGAQQLMQRSARLDYQPAIAWCIEQNVGF
jgi:TPR repeat protein/tRNA A-37 threonylcarbamoyl transferase component Bud32